MSRPAARRVAVVYLAVVAVAFAVVIVLMAVHDGPDASFAPVIAVVAAMPGSLAVLLLPDIAAPWDAIAGTAILVSAALLQAWVLYRLFRRD